jgi:Cof subfamily protein (haloacid dehalogenase superfamily)
MKMRSLENAWNCSRIPRPASPRSHGYCEAWAQNKRRRSGQRDDELDRSKPFRQSFIVNKISLVISDVDGTLVTPDKRLTDASVRAVRLLRERGIGFTLNSSRPPMGVRVFVEPLSLRLPIGTFNGGAMVGPDLKVIEQHLLPEPAARRSVDLLTAFSIDTWLFTTDDWLVRDPNGDYVPRERHTIQAEPSVVADFNPYLARVSKIVGSSKDLAKLAECEAATREALRGRASVARSQPYYLDITAPYLDKGTFVDALSNRLAVPLEAIATLGDMENDLAMFRKAGLSIAMGNASTEVKRQANYVTASNTDDGFARAIERYILD